MKYLIIIILVTIGFVGCGGGPEQIYTTGSQGAQGPTGVQGPAGGNGSNGENSLIATGIATTIQCPTGGTIVKAGLDLNNNGTLDYSEVTSTAVICNGLQGAVGATGPQGIQGPAGVNGTVITPVKFCSQTSNYPSTFPEYGLCINNNLYAVYSANDGFLTYIPPGAYHSNAIGSICDFTVLPNCKIQ